VGTISKRLAFNYLSPSAWASIGAIAAKLDEVWKDLNSQKARLDSYKAEVNSSVEKQVKLGREYFYFRLEEFKTAFILVSRGILDNSSRGLFTTSSHLMANPHSGLNSAADAASFGCIYLHSYMCGQTDIKYRTIL
jgi:hypothetical protein